MDYRAYRKVLRLVAELHVRGYQRLRIAPGMAPSGLFWRCTIAPVTCFSALHGGKLVNWSNESCARYTSGDERKYFGWTDAAHVTPSQLTDLFVARFPDLVRGGYGADWTYAGWYLDMLHLTHPGSFPIAYADWELPQDVLWTTGQRSDIRIPLPPPGWSDLPPAY